MRKTYEDISTRRLHCKNGANFIQCFQISAANPQDISRHHLSHFNQTQLKKKTSTPTLLLTNLPSQAVLQPARYHRKTKKILTPPSMIGFPRPVPSQPRSRQGFGLPMSGTNGSLAMPKFQSHPHSSESRRRDSTVPFHSDEGP